jgi:hypothetical protein
MKSQKDMNPNSLSKEHSDRFNRLYEEEKKLRASGKGNQSQPLSKLKELGISTEPTMVISFNQKKK